MSVDIVFSFDSTGSMYPAIAELRRKVAETIDTLFSIVPNLRIGLIAHGDYNDSPYETKVIDLTDDKATLIHFVKTVETTHGFGNGGECYEKVLSVAGKMSWYAEKRAFVMIGDEPAHSVGKRIGAHFGLPLTVSLDWRNELRLLQDALNITPYMVRCLNRSDSRAFHNEFSNRAQTPLLELAQFSSIVELLTALVFKQQSNDLLESYGNELETAGKLNRNVANLINSLLGKAPILPYAPVYAGDLVPVDPARFQRLHVDSATDIKSFVQSTGAAFKLGKGFYQLSKREEIQPRKEVVLVDNKTGDMFSGNQARVLIGLPYGERGYKDTYDIPREYTAYVQSTSVNRKLMPGTMFLYEASL